ncbi:hypothetical protein IFM89_035184, partial [Coptis chinensis]
EGNTAKYITRTKAVKYLQVSLQDFRRLCILKGVYPRDPKKKYKGNHKTYYKIDRLIRERLSHEWQAYISRTHSLRKTYIGVKGIYYQADVQGQKITWLTPHALQQVLSDEVDLK